MARGRQNPDDWDIEYDPVSEIDNSWNRNEPTLERATPSDQPPVTVDIDEAGLVTNVSLAADWKKTVDPRQLHTAVTSAVQAATMQALAHKTEQVDMAGSAPPPSPSTNAFDTSPLTPGDVQRLLDEVYSDLDRFNQDLSARVDQPVSTTSAGGHVHGSASKGQILELNIDPNWSSAARNSEIETELNEVLKRLSEQSSPGELAHGPQSRAISELNALARDPQQFLRRLGLPPQT